jgi:hypothetical protein
MQECIGGLLEHVRGQIDGSFLQYLKQILYSNIDSNVMPYDSMNKFVQTFSSYLNFSKSDGI